MAPQNDQAPRPAMPGMALVGIMESENQPRLCGVKFIGFDGFADGA